MKLSMITLNWMQKNNSCWTNKKLEEVFFNRKKSWTPQEFVEECLNLELEYNLHGDFIVWKLMRDTSKRISMLYIGNGFMGAFNSDAETSWEFDVPTTKEEERTCHLHGILMLDLLEEDER